MNSIRMRGKKSTPHRDPDDPPRRRANRRRGHGTYANDRPPLISIVNRQTGEQRIWVCDHADRPTCHRLVHETVPPTATLLASDEWRAYTGVHRNHHTVAHARGEWARDDDGDGRREVHCNTCEGVGAALRSFLRTFRGVHKCYLHRYVVLFEALYNAKTLSPTLIRRMCFGGHPSWYVYFT